MASSGDVNVINTISVGVCSNSSSYGGYTILIKLNYNIYAFITDCSDSSCSQCLDAFTLSINVCAPDPANSSYSYLLSNLTCWLAQTNPASITTGSVSMVYIPDSNNCYYSDLAGIVNFGSIEGGNSICIPMNIELFQFLGSALLRYFINGTYSGGLYCNADCSSCNNTFWNLPPGTCEEGSQAGTGISVTSTSYLWTCYTPPMTMYLAHVFDP